MIPLELIDTADLPDGGTLRLMRRGQDFMILFGRNELGLQHMLKVTRQMVADAEK